jgi:hypothetical protein
MCIHASRARHAPTTSATQGRQFGAWGCRTAPSCYRASSSCSSGEELGKNILDIATAAARHGEKLPFSPRAHLRDHDEAHCMIACVGEVTRHSSSPLSNSPWVPLLRYHTRLAARCRTLIHSINQCPGRSLALNSVAGWVTTDSGSRIVPTDITSACPRIQ